MNHPLPTTGAWRPGDIPGCRQFAQAFNEQPFSLEFGGQLASVTVAYETWGALAFGHSNAILILHALTGDSHAAGAVSPGHRHRGWWDDLIGPGAAIDTDRYFVVCPNVLGGCQGTTGPASPAPDGRPYGSRFPRISIRDQVVVEAALADLLGIRCWHAVVGGSLGGMRALEWAVEFPERLNRLVVFAVGAQASAEQIAWSTIQSQVIASDPGWRGGDYYDCAPGDGPARGMAIARGIGMVTYRTEVEFEHRFAALTSVDDATPSRRCHSVESYLEHHGCQLAHSFDANSYRLLNTSMNHHDLGRGRGGLAKALSRITARTTVVGIDTDRLYPLRQQEQLVALIPSSHQLVVIHSLNGHDAFLTEATAVGDILVTALEEVLALSLI